MGKKMAKGFINSIQKICMKDILLMERDMEKEGFYHLYLDTLGIQENFMLVIGKMTKCRAKDNFIQLKAKLYKLIF